jgi:hypothetical protein
MAPRELSEEHKSSMAVGRSEGRAVRVYLDALEQQRPRRGRPRTQETVQKRLATIAGLLPESGSLDRLQLLQERRDLEAELAKMTDAADIAELERGFVAIAASYGQRKGIAYATWRELGVPADVLARAGIKRG